MGSTVPVDLYEAIGPAGARRNEGVNEVAEPLRLGSERVATLLAGHRHVVTRLDRYGTELVRSLSVHVGGQAGPLAPLAPNPARCTRGGTRCRGWLFGEPGLTSNSQWPSAKIVGAAKRTCRLRCDEVGLSMDFGPGSGGGALGSAHRNQRAFFRTGRSRHLEPDDEATAEGDRDLAQRFRSRGVLSSFEPRDGGGTCPDPVCQGRLCQTVIESEANDEAGQLLIRLLPGLLGAIAGAPLRPSSAGGGGRVADRASGVHAPHRTKIGNFRNQVDVRARRAPPPGAACALACSCGPGSRPSCSSPLPCHALE